MKRALLAAGWLVLASPAQADTGWSQYGGDQGGQRHSGCQPDHARQCDGPAPGLELFDRGDDAPCRVGLQAAFENTPILDEGKLFVCSAFQEVSALDPGTGKEIWRFDPKLSETASSTTQRFNCRGVAYWKGSDGKGRIYLAANNRRLYALDAATGKPIASFGDHGAAVIDGGKLERAGQMQFSSAAHRQPRRGGGGLFPRRQPAGR